MNTIPRLTGPMDQEVVLEKILNRRGKSYIDISKRLSDLHGEFQTLLAEYNSLPWYNRNSIEKKMEINQSLRDELCQRLLMVT